MAAVHKIKAKEDSSSDKDKKQPSKVAQLSTDRPEKKRAKQKKSKQPKEPKQHGKFVRFLLFITTPFRAFGRYIRDSFGELRQVVWPTRKFTWKMTFAVIAYVALFAIFITLLDLLFTFIFSLLIK